MLNNTPLNYPLTTKQTPNCGYASSGWSVSQSKISGVSTRTSDYDTIDTATGVYSISAMDQANRAGVFEIAITSVTVNGVTYTGTQLVSPSTFILTASTGCSGTVVTASTVSNISLKVWDALAYYPLSGAAYSDFTDTVSTASGNPTLCSKTYTATISPPTSLSTFNLDTTQSKFQIYSGAYNQIGIYSVALKGAVTEEPTKFATTYFTITVTDPCLTTTLIQPTTALSDMTTSVLVASGPITQ